LSFGFRFSAGDTIDYSNARDADRISLSPRTSINFGRHLKLSLDYNLSRLSVEGGRLYQANVTQSNLVYQFNSRAFLRAILQFVDIRRNAALYDDEVDPKSQKLFSQYLFSYKLNPRTVFFLGYSDNYQGNQDFGITQTDRTFFVKIGYAWVL